MRDEIIPAGVDNEKFDLNTIKAKTLQYIENKHNDKIKKAKNFISQAADKGKCKIYITYTNEETVNEISIYFKMIGFKCNIGHHDTLFISWD